MIPTFRILTPAGTAAIAVIELIAEPAWVEALPSLKYPPAALEIGRIVLARWGEEELILCRTDPDRWEIQCHGGRAALERITRDLLQSGAKPCDRPLTEFETWEHAVSSAPTPRCLEYLLALDPHGLQNYVNEPALDQASRFLRIEELLERAEFGLHLTTPYRVVIAGPANVGKSHLINALLGFERVIVSPIPGTTRDVVESRTALEGWAVVLSDTAGWRDPGYFQEPSTGPEREIEALGIEMGRNSLSRADLRVIVFDISVPPPPLALESLDPGGLFSISETRPNSLLVLNKIDLPSAWPEIPPQALLISCRTGEGLDLLTKKIAQTLVPTPPPIGQLVPYSQSQIDWLLKK